jgi:fatty acid desaturase
MENQAGQSWADYRSNLKPRYAKVWLDIGAAYLNLAAALTVFASTELWFEQGKYFLLPVVPLGSLWVGFWLHSLACLFHEATHYGLLSNRMRNDWAANLVIGSLLGSGIKSYRRIHWIHHARLGSTEDTETSYFQPLTLRSLARDLTGRYQLNMLFGYLKKEAGGRPKPASSKSALAIAGLIHLGISLGLLISGCPLTGLMWASTFGVCYPMWNRIRQTLEHRSYRANDKVDYRLVDHGAENRMFGSDIFSRNFGPAGFNRHLLHHWDPAISYTQFDAMEAFLLQTPYGATIEETRTTYWRALREFVK